MTITNFPQSTAEREVLENLINTFLAVNPTSEFISLKIWRENSMLKFFFTNNQPPLKSPSLSQIHSQSIPNTPTATVTAPSSPLPPTSTPARISPKKKRERSSCSSTDNIRNTASTNSNTCQISVYDDEQDHTCEVLPSLICNNQFEALKPSEPVADPDPREAENV